MDPDKIRHSDGTKSTKEFRPEVSSAVSSSVTVVSAAVVHTPVSAEIDYTKLVQELAKVMPTSTVVTNPIPAASTTSVSAEIDYTKLVQELAKVMPTSTVVTNPTFDMESIKNLLEGLSFTNGVRSSHKSEKESCSGKELNRINAAVDPYSEIIALYYEFFYGEQVKNNIQKLIGLKNKKMSNLSNAITKLQNSHNLDEVDKNIKEAALKAEQKNINSDIRGIKSIQNSDIFQKSHLSIEQRLKQDINKIALSADEIREYNNVCASQLCFDESELIQGFCGVLGYGKFIAKVAASGESSASLNEEL